MIINNQLPDWLIHCILHFHFIKEDYSITILDNTTVSLRNKYKSVEKVLFDLKIPFEYKRFSATIMNSYCTITFVLYDDELCGYRINDLFLTKINTVNKSLIRADNIYYLD